MLFALTFTLAAAAFAPGGTMPRSTVYNRDGCRGGNRSPELHWSGAPRGTRSFALVAHDPDAPAPGGWYHWVVYNLPPTMRELPEAVNLPSRELGTTSFGGHPYGGPCPPPGKPHHYVFTLYALDLSAIPRAHLTGPQLEALVRAHTLQRTTLTGLYRS